MTSPITDETLLNDVEDSSFSIIDDPTVHFQITKDFLSSYIFQDSSLLPIQYLSSPIFEGPVSESLIENKVPSCIFEGPHSVLAHDLRSYNIKNLSSDIIEASVFSSLTIPENSSYFLQALCSHIMDDPLSASIQDHSFHPVQDNSASNIQDCSSTMLNDPTSFINTDISFILITCKMNSKFLYLVLGEIYILYLYFNNIILKYIDIS